jgi:hypothetical protein
MAYRQLEKQFIDYTQVAFGSDHKIQNENLKSPKSCFVWAREKKFARKACRNLDITQVAFWDEQNAEVRFLDHSTPSNIAF